MPRVIDPEFVRRVEGLVRNIILDENKLMKEVNKQKSRGNLEDDYLRKEIDHHNKRVNAVCLSIDQEIYKLLGVSDADAEFIAETLIDIRLSDFGYTAEAEKDRKISDRMNS